MDREFFKEYMNKLIALDDFVDKANEVGIDITDKSVGNIICGYISLLCAILEIPYEDNDISFYLYECDRGKADNAWIEFNNVRYPLTTLDELYNWLMIYKDETVKRN